MSGRTREIRTANRTQLTEMVRAVVQMGHPYQISVLVLRDLSATIPHLLVDEGRDELHEHGMIEVTAVLSLVGEGGRRHTHEHLVVPLAMWRALKVVRQYHDAGVMRDLAQIMNEAELRIRRGMSDDVPWT